MAKVTPSLVELAATILFALAVIHTFSVKYFSQLASRFAEGSVGENFFHLLAEVEAVFGIWAALLLAFMAATEGSISAVLYLEGLDFTEPAFVFVVMAVAATTPVLGFARALIQGVARLLPMHRELAFVFSALVMGPLLGSFITEPAAMTVTALLLRDRLFRQPVSEGTKYLALGALFVNISIGGVLTPYAAPPVLMVAKTFGWDFTFMQAHFGYKAVIAVLLNAALVVAVLRRESGKLGRKASEGDKVRSPLWLVALHLAALGMVVAFAHHMVVFMGVFLAFLAIAQVTGEHQSPLQLRESLLVGAFLAGLVVFGGLQAWWLKPLLASLDATTLFLGSAALTAVTDNAALTFLGSQVPGLSAAMQYALVAGAVAGGGMTVIANAPNPAGYSILQSAFGSFGISPLRLGLSASIPTLVAVLALWLLPHISI